MNRYCLAALLFTALAVSAPAAHAQPTREVTYDARAVVRLNAHLRMTTLVILPEGEDILDYVCGDKDFWVISGAQTLPTSSPPRRAPRQI
jgi:type IV secretory pathway VirB9-like protein